MVYIITSRPCDVSKLTIDRSKMSFKISHAVVLCMLFPAICAANYQDVEVSFTLTTRWQVRFTFKRRAFITPRRSRLNP